MRGLGTRFFGGSRVPVNRRSRSVSATIYTPPAPVWTGTPSYSVQEGATPPSSVLPVAASGDTVTVTWVSGTISGSTVLTQPGWIEFTAGSAPTIRFTGGQTDANDVTNLVLRATSAGGTADSPVGGAITITAAPGGSLTITYGSNEGTSIRATMASMKWQNNWATKDGTLIELGNGTHGHQTPNDIGEYDPVTKTQSLVEPSNIISGSFSGQTWMTATYGGFTQYDNHQYYYIPRIDSVVWPSRMQYVRGSSARSLSVKFPYASRSEVTSDGNTGNNTGISHVDGLPLGWKNNQKVVALSGGLIRPVGSAAGSTGWYDDPDRVFPDLFNPFHTWNSQLDVGFAIGGGNSVGDDHDVCWMIIPSARFGSYTEPYVLVKKDVPLIGGIRPNKRWGRNGIASVGSYVYWVCGGNESGSAVNHFWRLNLAPHINSDSESISLSTGPGAIERLSNAPFSAFFPLLIHDWYTNSLILISSGGLAMFDLRTFAWTTTPLTSANAAYLQEYAQYGFPIPEGCLGDYIHQRINGSTVTDVKKVIWRPGDSEPDAAAPQGDTRQRRYRSLQIVRPADQISYLSVTSENPENTSQDWSTNITENPKHQGLLVTGTSSNRRLYMMSGDFEGYPSTLGATGYKNEPGTFSGSGRQDVWAADISDSAIASSSVRFKMVSNGYAYYPWTGSQGYYNSATKGPRAMDALGSVIDKRGQIWLGPCDNNDYVDAFPEYRGQSLTYAAMYKWTQPGTNSTSVTGAGVNGVALGNAWTLPNQDKLYNPTYDGVNGVDYTISSSGASDIHGWGRTNARGSVYDSVNDKIYTISIGLNSSTSPKTFSIKLYGFSCVPDVGGVHRWTTTTITKNICDFGGPPDIEYSNLGTYGDNKKGGINCAPELIGRRMYFVALWGYSSPTGNLAATPLRRGYHTRAVLLSMNIDNPTDLEWIPFPQSQNWWCRMFDGPYAYESGQIGLPNNSAPCSTPAQQRGLTCVGTKVVLGPDCWTKIGVDPFLQVYDTVNKSWTSFAPPTTHDYPNTLDALVGVPELGEAWLVGSQALSTSDDAYPFVLANNIHVPPSNAGRRIVRFKVT